jgi:hypothetical protein
VHTGFDEQFSIWIAPLPFSGFRSRLLLLPLEEQELVNGYRLGANSYIRKPVDFNQFMEAIRQLGLYWLMLNEPAPVQRQ